MPIQARCPNCQTDYNLIDALNGKYVVCQQCQQPFRASDMRQVRTLEPSEARPVNIRESAPEPATVPPRKPAAPRTGWKIPPAAWVAIVLVGLGVLRGVVRLGQNSPTRQPQIVGVEVKDKQGVPWAVKDHFPKDMGKDGPGMPFVPPQGQWPMGMRSSLQEVQRFVGHANWIGGLALSSDGGRALCAEDRVIVLWDTATGQQVRRFEGHTATAWGLTFTPDDKRFVSAGDDNTVRLWDLATGEEVRRIQAAQQKLCGLALAPDGKHLLTAAGDRLLRLWDLDTGKELRRLPGHGADMRVFFSSDNSHALFYAEDGTIQLWDMDAGRELSRFQAPAKMRAVRLSTDGRQLLFGGEAGFVSLWDVDKAQEIRRFAGCQDIVCGLAFTPDGRHVLTAGHDGTVRLWNATTGKQLTQNQDQGGHCGRVTVSRDGRLALSNGVSSHVPKLLRLPVAAWPVPVVR